MTVTELSNKTSFRYNSKSCQWTNFQHSFHYNWSYLMFLDLKSISYWSCQTNNFKWSLIGDGFHSMRTWICRPKVSECFLRAYTRKTWAMSETRMIRRCWNWKEGGCSFRELLTIILVKKTLPWPIWENSMGYISTNFWCTMRGQNFLGLTIASN